MSFEDRQKITLKMKVLDILMIMSEGNPGAISVMTQVLNEMEQMEGLLGCILNLDDMNIRGSQIWIAYKDHCEQNLKLFIKLVKKRDQDMIDHVNQGSLRGFTGTQHRAVVNGGSYFNGRHPLTEADEYLLEKKMMKNDH